jgi:hypothetical protein
MAKKKKKAPLKLTVSFASDVGAVCQTQELIAENMLKLYRNASKYLCPIELKDAGLLE